MTYKFGSIVLMWVLLVSPQLVAGGEPQYPVLDSKFPAAEAKLGWIDNERVIFQGYEPGKFGTKSSKDGHVYDITGLFVWNTTTNVIIKHTSIEGLTALCVHAGEVTFAREGMLVTGKLGEERQTQFPNKHWFNPNSCRYYVSLPYWRINGQRNRSLPLLETHGYLDFGIPSRVDPSNASPVLLYPSDQKNAMQLPFTGEQVRFSVAYFEFADVYLLEGHRETTYATRIWLLKPDGTVTMALEPTGKPWERMGWGHYQLTKKGLFLTGGRGDYASVGTTGGYLLTNNEPVRIIAGFVRNAAVSPDGCKVAFVHVLHSQAGADSFRALKAGKPGTRTLQMIDLCKGD
jgi:hypothetical protein